VDKARVAAAAADLVVDLVADRAPAVDRAAAAEPVEGAVPSEAADPDPVEGEAPSVGADRDQAAPDRGREVPAAVVAAATTAPVSTATALRSAVR
jgi:hypothetical protein